MPSWLADMLDNNVLGVEMVVTEASLSGQIFTFRTIFQPLEAGLFTKYTVWPYVETEYTGGNLTPSVKKKKNKTCE